MPVAPCAGCLIQTTNRTKIQTQSSADRINTTLCQSEEKNNHSTQISPYMRLTQTTGPDLGGEKPKGINNSNLKPGKRRPQTQ